MIILHQKKNYGKDIPIFLCGSKGRSKKRLPNAKEGIIVGCGKYLGYSIKTYLCQLLNRTGLTTNPEIDVCHYRCLTKGCEAEGYREMKK